MGKLTQITVVNKESEWGDLKPGEITESSKPDVWMVCCPMCGNLGELRTHKVTEHEDGTYEPCTAHYFIDHNHIQWV